MDGPVPGVDVAAFTEWLRSRVPSVQPPLSFDRPAVGRSNLTYLVADAGGRRWVLRRPPLRGVLASAHDMSREFGVQAALAPTAVPVAAMVGLGEDESIIGAPFYVMDYVDGITVETAADAEDLAPPVRTLAAHSMVNTLAALHAVDVDEIGLGELGRREDYVGRQLRRWHRQWEAARTRELAAADEVFEVLSAQVPDPPRVALVHGDYRLDNLRVGTEGEVAAVLDWELCTLGDPLADVGSMLAFWKLPGEEVGPWRQPPAMAGGFPDRDALIELYGRESGLDMGGFDYYLAFALWRYAIILEGVYTRCAMGAYGEPDSEETGRLAAQAEWTAAEARRSLTD